MPTEDLQVIPFGHTPLVLVVDDELTPRSNVTRMIRALGYRALTCENAREALRFLKGQPGQVRLLLTDLIMPGMDGGELAERAKDLEPGLIIALMAARGDPPAHELLSGYRDLPFIPKPVSFSDLAEKLELLIGIPSRPTQPRQKTQRRRRSSGSHHG
jgi:two-component system cell cycle sensor histidine kinase/response regulator CckA